MNVRKEISDLAGFDPQSIFDRIDTLSKRFENAFQEPVSRTRWFLYGAVLGTAALYFLDPESGAKRRSQFREKAMSFGQNGMEYGQRTFQDVKDRAQDLFSQMTPSAVSKEGSGVGINQESIPDRTHH